MLFPDLESRVAEVRSRIRAAAERGGRGQEVTIVAVTKTHGPEAVIAAHEVGLGDVGENRVQEAVAKMDAVSSPVRWHLIGHLQRNKVKSLDRFTLFHALDSARLADAVSIFGVERGKPVDALVQVNVVGEETKGGFSRAELDEQIVRLTALEGVRIRGVMTMARLGADEAELRRTFSGARDALEVVKGAGHPATELSMGMSSDYEIAIEEGATMVRLGTTLFGSRESRR
jgi:pyridoxal phosphate enzyme (YggS family)